MVLVCPPLRMGGMVVTLPTIPQETTTTEAKHNQALRKGPKHDQSAIILKLYETGFHVCLDDQTLTLPMESQLVNRLGEPQVPFLSQQFNTFWCISMHITKADNIQIKESLWALDPVIQATIPFIWARHFMEELHKHLKNLSHE